MNKKTLLCIVLVLALAVAFLVFEFGPWRLPEKSMSDAPAYQIVAKLDQTVEKEKGGCWPFFPVDIYVRLENEPESLVYKGLNVCDPGGTTIAPEDGVLLQAGERIPYLFAYKPILQDGKVVGVEIPAGSGDAGMSWITSVFIPFANFERSFALYRWSDSNGPVPNLEVVSGEKKYVFGVSPSDPQCPPSNMAVVPDFGITINNEKVWSAPEAASLACWQWEGMESRESSYVDEFEYRVSMDGGESRVRVSFVGYNFDFDPWDPVETFRSAE